MKTHANSIIPPVPDSEWVAFPGGELEGRRPKVLCPSCREQLHRRFDSRRSPGESNRSSSNPSAGTGRSSAPLCFDCYRAELARERSLKAAGELDTASEARFQSLLPLEPVNRSRLVRLQAERESARVASRSGTGAYVDRRRQAQIAARHALQQIGAGLRRHAASLSGPSVGSHDGSNVGSHDGSNAASNAVRHADTAAGRTTPNEVWAAIHAAELQLPETWLPFVTAR
jgi:hypothetical protein